MYPCTDSVWTWRKSKSEFYRLMRFVRFRKIPTSPWLEHSCAWCMEQSLIPHRSWVNSPKKCTLLLKKIFRVRRKWSAISRQHKNEIDFLEMWLRLLLHTVMLIEIRATVVLSQDLCKSWTQNQSLRCARGKRRIFILSRSIVRGFEFCLQR